ncbi:hypothetical protein [Exercitatus varius]|uniref:hypothetical protein n=1 Tax=Exercitatus varius TaxID=67857 RepID=UPI00294B86B1|nr:hypothetical protein [Exercitatus varius]MDG2961689.1 hypothetical protein [Exercitatus varius]
MMLNCEELNYYFNPKLSPAENLSFYADEKQHLLAIPKVIVVFGRIGIGKSTLINYIAPKINYSVVTHINEINENNHANINGICLDLTDFGQMDNGLKNLINIDKKIIISTIEYDYLKQLNNWELFIKKQKRQFRMRTSPIQLCIASDSIIATTIF